MRFTSQELFSLLESEMTSVVSYEPHEVKMVKRDMKDAGIKYELFERDGAVYLEVFR